MSNSRRAQLRLLLLPGFVLAFGLVLTWLVSRTAADSERAQARQQFERRADVMQELIERRFAQATDSLRSLAAAHRMAGRMTDRDLQAFAEGKSTGIDAPWIRGYGLLRVDLATGALHVRSFAPPEGYEHVPGQALGADPVKRIAALQAIETGFPTSTPPVRLAETSGVGWVLFLPLFHGHPRSVAQRRAALDALMYLPLVAREVLEPVTDFSGEQIAVRVHDDDVPELALYDDGAFEPAMTLSTVRPLRFGGRRLSMEVAGAPQQGRSWSAPWLVACAGGAVSLALAMLTYVLQAGRHRAIAAARNVGGQMERLAGMVDHARAAVFTTDAEGRLTWANKAFEDIGGVPRSEVLGEPLFDMPGLDVSLTGEQVEAMRSALAADGVANLEAEARRRDGSTFWLEVAVQRDKNPDGSLKGYYAIGQDVTKRKLAELRVHDNEHMMRLITDNIPARISYWDAQGRCLFANKRHRMAYGEPPKDGTTVLEGARYAPFMTPERLQVAMDRLRAGESQHFEHSSPAADGQGETSWLVHFVPDVTEHGVTGFFSLASEITELKAARDQALEGSRAKTRFLSSMSHEIRTPMNAVLGMLALLRRTPLSGRQQDYVDKAHAAGMSLLSLLNDVLDLSKIEAGKMQLDLQPFSLEKMLGELSVVLSANVGAKDIEVLYDLDPAVPDALIGDDMRLRQILINLGGNAVKFTSRGEVILHTRLVRRDAAGALVEFSVCDAGIGITPEQQQRLFEDFAQASSSTSRQFGGSGLGLTICRRLLDLMGANLTLFSTPGAGSCFSFEVLLPVQAGGIDVPPAPPRRVLLVDDNEIARETLLRLAAAVGWRADAVVGGEQALEAIAAAAAQADPYGAVFVDWSMPGLDGWEASLRIRALPRGGRTPLLVMVTAYGREILEARAAQGRDVLDGFLVKPVTASMLREAVERAASRHGLSAPSIEPPPRAAPEDRPLEGLRLLLAEDNPINQQIARELLASQGAQVDVVDNGADAVQRLREAPQGWDLVLMDLLMPVLGGLEATRRIRGELQLKLPVVAMTANAMDTDRAECLAAGMDGHVAKPFVLSDVVDAVLRQCRPSAVPAAPVAGDAIELPRTPLLDEAGAIERLGGDRALFEKMVPVFRRNLVASREQLQRAVWAGEVDDDLRRTMHTLKGMASTMGAMRLAEAARHAEGALSAAPTAMPSEVDSVFGALEATLERMPGPGA